MKPIRIHQFFLGSLLFLSAGICNAQEDTIDDISDIDINTANFALPEDDMTMPEGEQEQTFHALPFYGHAEEDESIDTNNDDTSEIDLDQLIELTNSPLPGNPDEVDVDLIGEETLVPLDTMQEMSQEMSEQEPSVEYEEEDASAMTIPNAPQMHLMHESGHEMMETDEMQQHNRSCCGNRAEVCPVGGMCSRGSCPGSDDEESE